MSFPIVSHSDIDLPQSSADVFPLGNTTPQLTLSSDFYSPRLEGGFSSPVTFWNSSLSDHIAEFSIGPTKSSRAYALLNSTFYDLLVLSQQQGVPLYLDQTIPFPTFFSLEEQLDIVAHYLISNWFSLPHSISSLPESVSSWLSQQIAHVPSLDPDYLISESNSYSNILTSERRIDLWTPEHVPIDDLDAPLQNELTPYWGDIAAFSFDDVSQLRPIGPEPFLLVHDQEARYDPDNGLLYVHLPIVLNDSLSLVIDPGIYDLSDPLVQESFIGVIVNPDFITQAQFVVDIQSSLTDKQKLSAEFWEDGTGSSFPPGTWVAITSLMAAESELSLADQIQLFFAVGQALGDAGIAAWDSKTHFNYARPVRVIRDLALVDLLDGFELDQWIPYQLPGSDPSPPFAEYVSGHSTFSAAASGVLQAYFGSDHLNLSFDIPSGGSRFEPGLTPESETTLSWSTLTEAADDAGFSRLYGGIHFNDANIDGLSLGDNISSLVLKESQRLFYSDIDDSLHRPFLLANTATVSSDSHLIIDGNHLDDVSLLDLSGGDDFLSVGIDSSFTGFVTGGSGSDTLSFANWTKPVFVSLDSSSSDDLEPFYSDFEIFVGGQGDDRLQGSINSTTFISGSGSDRFIGVGSNDMVIYPGDSLDYKFQSIGIESSTESSSLPDFDRITGIEWLKFDDGIWSPDQLFDRYATWLSIDLTADIIVSDFIPLTLEREGDLTKSLSLTFSLSDHFEPSITDTSFLPRSVLDSDGFLNSSWSITLPENVRTMNFELPLDWISHWNGNETGFLSLDSVQFNDLPFQKSSSSPGQVYWTDKLIPFQLPMAETYDSIFLTQSFAPISPLPIWIAPSSEHTIPLSVHLGSLATIDTFDSWRDGLSIGIDVPSHFDQFSFVQSFSSDSTNVISRQSTVESGPGGQRLRLDFGNLPYNSSEDQFILGDLDFSISDTHSLDNVIAFNLDMFDPLSGEIVDHQIASFRSVDWSLDIDGDGIVKPLSDGLLIMRYLFGFSGHDLINKVVNSSGSRSSLDSITEWIDEGVKHGWLDIDGDGEVLPLSDGLLIMRSLMGIQGFDLIKGSISDDSPIMHFSENHLSFSDYASSIISNRVDAISNYIV